MKRKKIKKILEIIPGVLSWGILCFFAAALLVNPLAAAVIIIVYLMYWGTRLCYMSVLLIIAHHRMTVRKNADWLNLCRQAKTDLNFEDIIQVVLYTTYKEPLAVLEDSIGALRKVDYPKEKIILVIAGEERAQDAQEKLTVLKEKFKNDFADVITTIHPKDIKGEIRCKGANATFAAKKAKEYLQAKNYKLENIIISCFDADTRPDKAYFSCLAYYFLCVPKRHQTSFQPFPIYSNNIYKAPAFARIIEMGSTFWQLVESMRYEKFITFSSHSMSFKTLVEAGYWPVDMISDDSLIFWKCFLKYEGDYNTCPLDVPVYMDIAVGKGFWDTVRVQYKQKRRWAWGVENFVFVGMEFLSARRIPLTTKIRKLYQILDNHVNWATWSIIISFISPLILIWGKIILKNSLVFFNLSYINNIIFHALSFILFLCMFMSLEFLPPRPKEVTRFFHVIFMLQWLFVPFVSAFLGSLPALDAQTRLIGGRYLSFYATPKSRT